VYSDGASVVLLATIYFLRSSGLQHILRLLSISSFHDIVIIIIIIIIIISFMQGIYAYIPETNYVPREYSVGAILLLLFMVLTSLI